MQNLFGKNQILFNKKDLTSCRDVALRRLYVKCHCHAYYPILQYTSDLRQMVAEVGSFFVTERHINRFSILIQFVRHHFLENKSCNAWAHY